MSREGTPRVERTGAEESSPARFREAFSLPIEHLVRRWESLIRGSAYRYGLPDEDRDELTQDVRIRLWRALERGGESPPGMASSYVYQVVTSAAVDLLRRRRDRGARELSLEDVATALPAAAARETDEAELESVLERALSTLPTDRRIVVRMHLDGLHRDEIARLRGWSSSRTRNLLYRGLEDLKRALQAKRKG